MTSGVERATCALSGTPMFPPTSTCIPAASNIRPINVVVVDLPLVPVTATMRPRSQRDASSSSPITGMSAARAAATSGCAGETPGLSTIKSAPRSVSARWPPSSSCTPASRSLMSCCGLERGPQIRENHVRASRREQFRGRDPAARGPHHHDPLSINREHRLVAGRKNRDPRLSSTPSTLGCALPQFQRRQAAQARRRWR